MTHKRIPPGISKNDYLQSLLVSYCAYRRFRFSECGLGYFDSCLLRMKGLLLCSQYKFRKHFHQIGITGWYMNPADIFNA